MKVSSKSIKTLLTVLTLAAALVFSGQVLAAEGTKGDKTDLLTGKAWQLLTVEGKRAYILGAGELADIEAEMIARHPHMKRDGFTEKFAEALEGIPIDEIVNGVDAFFKENPDQVDVSVMTVIWDTMIKPKVGSIAGKPMTK